MTGLLERKNRHYPLLLKRKIAFEVVTKQKGLSEASREYDIPKKNVAYWVKQFGAEILQEQTKEVLPSPDMKKSKEKTDVDFAKQIQLLEEENLKLREKLLNSDLRAQALSTLIDLAEENYGLSLRKNSGAKRSKD